jgi:hypothetical protein
MRVARVIQRIGRWPCMREPFAVLARIAPTDMPVSIEGNRAAARSSFAAEAFIGKAE